MKEDEILDEEEKAEHKSSVISWVKRLSLLILFELFTSVVMVFGDPFHIGIEYMGEGLPMMFGLLFSWIATFVIWAIWCIYYAFKK